MNIQFFSALLFLCLCFHKPIYAYKNKAAQATHKLVYLSIDYMSRDISTQQWTDFHKEELQEVLSLLHENGFYGRTLLPHRHLARLADALSKVLAKSSCDHLLPITRHAVENHEHTNTSNRWAYLEQMLIETESTLRNSFRDEASNFAARLAAEKLITVFRPHIIKKQCMPSKKRIMEIDIQHQASIDRAIQKGIAAGTTWSELSEHDRFLVRRNTELRYFSNKIDLITAAGVEKEGIRLSYSYPTNPNLVWPQQIPARNHAFEKSFSKVLKYLGKSPEQFFYKETPRELSPGWSTVEEWVKVHCELTAEEENRIKLDSIRNQFIKVRGAAATTIGEAAAALDHARIKEEREESVVLEKIPMKILK